MGYVGFDELSLMVKGMSGAMHFAKTSNDPAGVGYSTNAPKNKKDGFHVKWHPVSGSNVVDRFHVKNESIGRSIYYGISLKKALSYFKPGPDGAAVSYAFYDYDKYLLEDCDDIADVFLNKLYRTTYQVYDKEVDAQAAYEERQKSEKAQTEARDKKNNLAVAYARIWPKLSASDKVKNPQIGAVAIRQRTLAEVEDIYNKILALLPPGSVPEQEQAKMIVPLPIPQGYVASPGASAHIAVASSTPGGTGTK